MKKIFYILTTLNLILTPLYSQSITWSRYYMSPMFSYENSGYDICKADDNNFYLIGTHEYPPKAMIIKINEYGDTLWMRFMDSTAAGTGTSSGDGGCVLTGYNEIYPHYPYTIKFNSTGTLEWFKVYNNQNPLAQCNKIIKTRNNGYIMCGFKGYDFGIIVKINESGNLIWQKEYLSTGYKYYYSIVEAYTSGYLAAGYITNNIAHTSHGIITRIDTLGNIIWEKEYSISNIRIYLMRSIDTLNNSYVTGGFMYDSLQDKYLIGFLRLDTNGKKLTEKIYKDDTYPIYLEDLKTSNNRIILNAYEISAIDSAHARIYIIDSSGNIIKYRKFTESKLLTLNSNITLPNNDLIFVGQNKNTYMFTYATRTDSNLYSPPIKVIKLSEGVPSSYQLFQNYPNPFNPVTRIKFAIPLSRGVSEGRGMSVRLTIYDILGREITLLVNEHLKTGMYEVEWNATNYPSGIYFYRLSVGEYIESKKMILIK